MKGYGLTAAAGLYQRIELFDNAKALSVLRILVVPFIVEILINNFIDDLVDPVCQGIFPFRYNLAILRAATMTSALPVWTIRKPSFVEETRLYFL